MTAVIYARYSSDNQREESIEGQIRECTAYAEKNDITIVKHYIDRAISAKTDNRPQFQQMIKDSDKKLFDIVLVWKLDRFARNRYDSARYKTQLKKNGVKLMSATEIISEGPEGIILESVLEGYAEYYSADLAEKVVRGQTENILKGRCNGGRGTFGYTLDSERKFHIDPLASPFVLESFTKYRDGLTMKEIRDWLNENGIKNPVGGEFTYNSVEHMLKNRRYIGELKFRDVVVPNAIPPIIPLELFEDVQEKIADGLGTTLSEVYGVATFYENFSLDVKGKYVLKVCRGTACHVRKSGNVLQALYDATGLSESKPTSDDGLFTIEIVSCLGACGLSPVVMVNDTVHPAMTPDKAVDLIEELREKEGA